MKVIGLTGGIATGKSTVGRLLAEHHGVAVIDADQASRTVLAPSGIAYAPVVEAFGRSILAPDDQVDRAKLRRLVMSDAEARRRLESITHPAIRATIASGITKLAAEGRDHAVVEAALLVETGSYTAYPALIVVSCAPHTQIARVKVRDRISEEAARQILAAQLPMAAKEAVATVVIHNDGDLDELKVSVAAAWKQVS